MAESATPEENGGTSEWVDVTDVLSSITPTMELGAMIHPSDFDLHAAMSALEIGDGVLDNGMQGRVIYMKEILAAEALMGKLVSIESGDEYSDVLLGTLDELTRRMWSFLSGNSDQHSIFSCLLLYPEIEQHPQMPPRKASTLYLFIDAVKLCCGYAREIVALSAISEDDDWARAKCFEFSD